MSSLYGRRVPFCVCMYVCRSLSLSLSLSFSFSLFFSFFLSFFLSLSFQVSEIHTFFKGTRGLRQSIILYTPSPGDTSLTAVTRKSITDHVHMVHHVYAEKNKEGMYVCMYVCMYVYVYPIPYIPTPLSLFLFLFLSLFSLSLSVHVTYSTSLLTKDTLFTDNGIELIKRDKEVYIYIYT